jgi:hypothetical protein
MPRVPGIGTIKGFKEKRHRIRIHFCIIGKYSPFLSEKSRFRRRKVYGCIPAPGTGAIPCPGIANPLYIALLVPDQAHIFHNMRIVDTPFLEKSPICLPNS